MLAPPITEIDQLIQQVETYFPQGDTDLIRRAYAFSAKAHEGQTTAIWGTLSPASFGRCRCIHVPEIRCACHCCRAYSMTLSKIRSPLDLSWRNILEMMWLRLVEGVTKIGKIPFKSHEEKQAENFRKMVLSMANDIRVVVFIKLADRLHNMETLEHLQRKQTKADSPGNS